ncbi:MAG: hypothetical protein KJ767_02305 [Nanoarchaeota archaeon]|nr:hypothetical protein [Nanoarchaeota archaeon]
MPKRDKRISESKELVFSLGKEFRDTGVPLDDILQEGFLALIEASDMHDDDLPKEDFDKYATIEVRKRMKGYIENQLYGSKREVYIDPSCYLCRSGTPIKYAR